VVKLFRRLWQGVLGHGTYTKQHSILRTIDIEKEEEEEEE
jgi:hypothetical protein